MDLSIKINQDTPLAMLTVSQFLDLIDSIKQSEPAPQKKERVYVYGLRGIRQLFNVSHATAQRYKDTIIRDAVSQQGRKIIVDVERAMELFNDNKGRKRK